MKNNILMICVKIVLINLTLINTIFAALDSTAVIGQNGMVSSQDEYATTVGLNILKEGGNAVDAAIAVAYTMAVTHPRAGNIGGGGFMMIYHKQSNQSTLRRCRCRRIYYQFFCK